MKKVFFCLLCLAWALPAFAQSSKWEIEKSHREVQQYNREKKLEPYRQLERVKEEDRQRERIKMYQDGNRQYMNDFMDRYQQKRY